MSDVRVRVLFSGLLCIAQAEDKHRDVLACSLDPALDEGEALSDLRNQCEQRIRQLQEAIRMIDAGEVEGI